MNIEIFERNPVKDHFDIYDNVDKGRIYRVRGSEYNYWIQDTRTKEVIKGFINPLQAISHAIGREIKRMVEK